MTPATAPDTDYGVSAAFVGTLMWLVAALLAMWNRAWLAGHAASWLLATACAGVVIGLIEFGLFSRRRRVYQTHQ